jgi:hypothetical protein
MLQLANYNAPPTGHSGMVSDLHHALTTGWSHMLVSKDQFLVAAVWADLVSLGHIPYAVHIVTMCIELCCVA